MFGEDAASIYLRQRQEAAENRLLIEVGDNCVIVNKSLKLSIRHGDNIMILEDEYKSNYDCKECGGTGKKKVQCLKCDGKGWIYSPTQDASVFLENWDKETCGKCDGTGSKEETCKACNGKGALIEIPDQAKSRPTSGKVVAWGPDCILYNSGDRVAYNSYTGSLLPFKGNNRIRVMRETEPFCLLEEIAADGKYEEVQFIDKDNAYDVS
jgi:co-chaperonin GroES (HSP10)